MQRMEMLLSKTPATDVTSDVLPMIYRALESDTAQIQELCLSIIPGFAGMYQLGFVSAWQFLALVPGGDGQLYSSTHQANFCPSFFGL